MTGIFRNSYPPITDGVGEDFAGRTRELVILPGNIRQAGLQASESIACWGNVTADEVMEHYTYIIRNHGYRY
jgi:hypothetical protein